jgi:hypothetical protein
MVMSPDGQLLCVAGHDPSTLLPIVQGIFPALPNGAVSAFFQLALGGVLVEPTGVGFSLDGKTVYIVDSGSRLDGNAILYSCDASGNAQSALNVLGTITDTTRVGGGVVIGFDGGVNFVSYAGAVAGLSSIPTSGGSQTVRTSSTGSGPFVQPMQCARDGNNIYTVDSEATGNGCVVVSQ